MNMHERIQVLTNPYEKEVIYHTTHSLVPKFLVPIYKIKTEDFLFKEMFFCLTIITR